MKNYSFKEESNRHPYKYYGGISEVFYKGVSYLVKHDMEYIIDDYDPYIESVEQSHYEPSDYRYVDDYNILDDTDTLDFTWLSPIDFVDIKYHSDYEQIKNIRMNINNMPYSFLPRQNKDKQLSLTVCNGKNSKNLLKQVYSLNKFIKRNKDRFNTVSFEGFSSITEQVLSVYAERNGIKVLQKENSIEKQRVKK